jgi:2-polyprenyl-3-methyl-5-hydroxy-6-metoxy-1,4-benzoquinol methylase
MPIGSTLSKTSNSRVAALLKSALGSPEIHNHTRLRPVLKYFRKRSAEQLKILEIGCGTGDLLIEICSIGSDFSATGVDIDPASIMLATRHLELISPARGIKFVVGDALEWDNEEVYDVVILIDVLEHLHETDHVLETVRRRLKPGGTFLVSVPTPMSPVSSGESFTNRSATLGTATQGKLYLTNALDFVVLHIRTIQVRSFGFLVRFHTGSLIE